MSTDTHMAQQQVLKQKAAQAAAAELQDGMIIGLGSGTTSRLAVEAIGARVRQGLKVVGVPTSESTADQAHQLNIPLATLGDYPQLDLTIDGADEVELGPLNLIKGGGGNLLREKIVATASSRLIIIVDESKLVTHLGAFKLPVEVPQFGWQSTARALEKLNGHPGMRMTKDGKPFTTDGGNFILDCAFGHIQSPAALQDQLDKVVGVVEHGLFIHMTSFVLVGTEDGIKRLDPTNSNH